MCCQRCEIFSAQAAAAVAVVPFQDRRAFHFPSPPVFLCRVCSVCLRLAIRAATQTPAHTRNTTTRKPHITHNTQPCCVLCPPLFTPFHAHERVVCVSCTRPVQFARSLVVLLFRVGWGGDGRTWNGDAEKGPVGFAYMFAVPLRK